MAIVICIGLLMIGYQYAENLFAQSGSSHTVGSDIGTTAFTKAASSTGMTISNVSQQVAATNTARTYVRVSNANTTGVVFCNANSGASAVASSGIMIAAGGSVALFPDDDDLYRGQINCISSAVPSALITVFEHN